MAAKKEKGIKMNCTLCESGLETGYFQDKEGRITKTVKCRKGCFKIQMVFPGITSFFSHRIDVVRRNLR